MVAKDKHNKIHLRTFSRLSSNSILLFFFHVIYGSFIQNMKNWNHLILMIYCHVLHFKMKWIRYTFCWQFDFLKNQRHLTWLYFINLIRKDDIWRQFHDSNTNFRNTWNSIGNSNAIIRNVYLFVTSVSTW